ncbi:MAG: DNA polymerase III subunit delta [Bacteroidota bacterium]|nr:DNA polymerase III subunit delta [Bacteroidota bacterium]
MANSAPLTAEEILKELKSGKTWPIIFLQGEEPYYIDLISSYIEKHLLSEADKGFNQTVLYGKDVDINTVITNAKRFPMMAPKQLVLVKEANELKDIDKVIKNKIGGKEIEFIPLLEYAKNPLDSTILVFAYKYKTLDGRKPLPKVIEEKGLLFTSKGLYDDKLPAWITSVCSSKGHTIAENASRLLAECVGNNLSRLSNEIDKIIINLKEKTTITEDIVHKYVGISKEYNVFELQNALSRKDVLKCNKIIQYFSENKKDNLLPLVLGSLFTYFTKILLIKSNKPKDEFEASKVVGVPPFIAKEYLMASKNYSDEKVLSFFSYLREADMRSKGVDSGSMDDYEIMKELIFKILH